MGLISKVKKYFSYSLIHVDKRLHLTAAFFVNTLYYIYIPYANEILTIRPVII